MVVTRVKYDLPLTSVGSTRRIIHSFYSGRGPPTVQTSLPLFKEDRKKVVPEPFSNQKYFSFCVTRFYMYFTLPHELSPTSLK